MMHLPLERLLKIATHQARPGVVVGSHRTSSSAAVTVSAASVSVDTSLAARMVANGLSALLRKETWRRRVLGPQGQVCEANDVRVMLWMDSRDDQPGMVAVWDLARKAPSGKTKYGAVLPRPVLVIGRNVRSGEHFVLRYAPGEWLARLQEMSYEVRRFAS
ncbi:MAG TPA: hypothetical protein VH590_12700 [Ktedonobacterales bacterium]